MTQIITTPENRKLKAEIEVMKKAARKIAEDPEKARQFLIKGGFITKGRKLTKRYGG